MDKISEELLNLRPMLLTGSDVEVIKILAKFLAKNFIARSDVKAIQKTVPKLMYNPVESPWLMQDFADHLTGRKSYGHYLLDSDNNCKIFVMDIDFKKVGKLPTIPTPIFEDGISAWVDSFTECNIREAWLDRSHPARTWMKTSLRMAAGRLAKECRSLDIPTIIAYTGSKGLHVYGLIGALSDYENGRAPGIDAYDLSHAVLESTGFKPFRGNVFYNFADGSDLEYSILEIEAFPKQTSINDGGYGNLVRLPYGINLKSPREPTFFIDEESPLTNIVPATLGQILSTVN